MAEERFCPSCGEMVETLSMVKRGSETTLCSNCGLEIKDAASSRIRTLRAVLCADDSPLLLRKVAEMLEARHVSQTVVACKNGEELLEKAVARLRVKLPVSLVILDVTMPILNGVNAALALRSIERGMEGVKKIPILFFTSNKCDDGFKKVIAYCAPAHYINKGVGSSPDEFAERLYSVIAGLLTDQSGKEQ